MTDPRPLTMKFAGRVVKHLGLQMYAGPVPAISELISNAWDADAENVHVDIDFGKKISPSSIIKVRDDGHGMGWDDCNSKYMIIGRDARTEEGSKTGRRFERKRMARKGLGKLSGFGIANIVEIVTVKNKKRTRFVLDYGAIEKLGHGDDYKIEPSEDDVQTDEDDGTVVILRDLKLKNTITEEVFVRRIARRFSVLSDKFKITINNIQLKKDNGPFQIYFPNPHMPADKEKIIDKKGEYEIPGAGKIVFWIGFTEKPIRHAESRGISVLARGKLVQDPWFFDVSGGTSGQHGLQYMTGEVEADFLDDETDYVTSGRNSIMWDMEVPSLLQEWGRQKVTTMLARWAEERGKIKLSHIKRATQHMERIKKFPKRPQKELTTMVRKIASIDTIEDDRLVELVGLIINAYENKELVHMINEVSSLSSDAQAKLFDILQEFKVLESVSLAQIVKSRIKIIEKFEELIDAGVREKPDMQNHLRDYPWLISPEYTSLSHEKRLEAILREKFHTGAVGSAKNKRIDFFCLGDLGRAFVIEVKRPKTKVGTNEIRQLANYVDFLRQNNRKISDPKNKKIFFGYLVGSEYSDDAEYEIQRMEKDGIYTKTWDDLLDAARRSHKDYFDTMRKNVPEGDPRLEDFDNMK